jgi:hypothetical protein
LFRHSVQREQRHAVDRPLVARSGQEIVEGGGELKPVITTTGAPGLCVLAARTIASPSLPDGPERREENAFLVVGHQDDGALWRLKLLLRTARGAVRWCRAVQLADSGRVLQRASGTP